MINQEGFTLDEIRKLFLDREGNKLVADNIIPFQKINEMIWDIKSEIFIPAAASRLISRDQIERMANAGLEVISCGANVPFSDPEIFFGQTGLYADERVAVIPDFIANCGMARVFAYLMSEKVELTDDGIFKDVSKTIAKALKKTHAKNPERTKIAQASFAIALNQLV